MGCDVLPELSGVGEAQFFAEITTLAGGGETIDGDGLGGRRFAIDFQETRMGDGGVLIEGIGRIVRASKIGRCGIAMVNCRQQSPGIIMNPLVLEIGMPVVPMSVVSASVWRVG